MRGVIGAGIDPQAGGDFTTGDPKKRKKSCPNPFIETRKFNRIEDPVNPVENRRGSGWRCGLERSSIN
jgi:hypothetical protein